jgi:hypothetical protein
MRDSSYNSLVLGGLAIGAVLLIGTVVTGSESRAPEVFEGLCSLAGGAIGAGGAALAVFLALSWQKEDEKIQTLTALYLEFSGYLYHCLQYHALILAALKGDGKVKEFIFAGIHRTALDLPLPVFFPSVVRSITRLKEPSLVTSFYTQIDSMRKSAKSDLFTTPDGGAFTPLEMRYLILSLILPLRSGLDLLKSPDFDQIYTANRIDLIRRIEVEMSNSPAAATIREVSQSPSSDS